MGEEAEHDWTNKRTNPKREDGQGNKREMVEGKTADLKSLMDSV